MASPPTGSRPDGRRRWPDRGAPRCGRQRCSSEVRAAARSAGRRSSCPTPVARRSTARMEALPPPLVVIPKTSRPDHVSTGSFVRVSGSNRCMPLLVEDEIKEPSPMRCASPARCWSPSVLAEPRSSSCFVWRGGVRRLSWTALNRVGSILLSAVIARSPSEALWKVLQKDHAVTALHVSATPITGTAAHHFAGRHSTMLTDRDRSEPGR